jgi:hypothetical protein
LLNGQDAKTQTVVSQFVPRGPSCQPEGQEAGELPRGYRSGNGESEMGNEKWEMAERELVGSRQSRERSVINVVFPIFRLALSGAASLL